MENQFATGGLPHRGSPELRKPISCVEIFCCFNQMLESSAQSVEAPDYKRVAFTQLLLCISHSGRSTLAPLTLSSKMFAASCFERIALQLEVLFDAADVHNR